MNIAYTMAPGRGDVDALLLRVSDQLHAAGMATCGTVQINTECDTGGPCDMDVKVLPDGPMIRISQSLGKDAKGCRLDPAALETAIGECQPRLEKADVLLVNKFGKHEASGRGFRDLIAEAMAMGTPVVVGLNGLNKDAFDEFTGGVGVELAPEANAIATWVKDRVGAVVAQG